MLYLLFYSDGKNLLVHTEFTLYSTDWDLNIAFDQVDSPIPNQSLRTQARD